MRNFKRIFSAVLCAAAVVSGTAITAGAVDYKTVVVPAGCTNGSCVITPNGCDTFDLSDIQSVISKCGGNQTVISNNCASGSNQAVIGACADGSCDIQGLLSQCGILPDNEKCTDGCGNEESTQSYVPSVPVQPVQPQQPAAAEESNSEVSVPSNAADVSEYEKQVVDIVNRYRAQYGLSPVTLNTELSKVARLKSEDMKNKNYFSHTSPTYGSPFDMMKQFGISYRKAGENIAMGQTTPEAVMTAWMNSDGHRANILDPDFTQIGVGYVADGNYWTQMFIA